MSPSGPYYTWDLFRDFHEVGVPSCQLGGVGSRGVGADFDGRKFFEDPDEVAVWLECDRATPLESLIQISERLLTYDLLKKVLPRCNKMQYIFATVAAKVILSGESVSHWSDGFTTEQRMEFMTDSSGETSDSEEVFRREVNRAYRQVVEKMRTLFKRIDGHWIN